MKIGKGRHLSRLKSERISMQNVHYYKEVIETVCLKSLGVRLLHRHAPNQMGWTYLLLFGGPRFGSICITKIYIKLIARTVTKNYNIGELYHIVPWARPLLRLDLCPSL